MKYQQLDSVDLRGRFGSEEEFNDRLREYWERGEQILEAVISPEQNQILIDAQPRQLENPETGELFDNPIFFDRKPAHVFNVYESDYMRVKITVKD